MITLGKIPPKEDVKLLLLVHMQPADFPATHYANIIVIISLICKLSWI